MIIMLIFSNLYTVMDLMELVITLLCYLEGMTTILFSQMLKRWDILCGQNFGTVETVGQIVAKKIEVIGVFIRVGELKV